MVFFLTHGLDEALGERDAMERAIDMFIQQYSLCCMVQLMKPLTDIQSDLMRKHGVGATGFLEGGNK